MSTSTPHSSLDTIEKYLEAIQEYYDACLDHVDHDFEIAGVEATIRLHYLQLDGNRRPKTKALAQAMVDHVIYFCKSARQRPETLTAHGISRLFTKARDLFRKLDRAGEPGEILLYFLLETVLKAPQVVCKMSLKTNPSEEVKGGDGIHIRWNEAKDQLQVYLGEAKLYTTYGKALDAAFESIESFYESGREDHELSLVTAHFKQADDELRRAVSDYLDGTSPVGSYRIHQACLIGYNWSEYKHLGTETAEQFISEFKDRYLKHAKQLVEKVKGNLAECKQTHLAFEFFFLPFTSVQDFRDEFNRALTGNS